MTNKTFQIAIDGPVAAGKGTTAKIVAQRLGYLYVDTGAIYRALTYFAVQNGIDWEKEGEVVKLVEANRPMVELRVPAGETKDGRLCTIILNGEDVSWKVRTEEISRAVSPVAQYQRIREYVNELAREMASKQDVVMEGRDITGVVLPEADLKIYMDAEPKERARRRHQELLRRGEDINFDNVYKDLMERDKRDMENNLRKVSDAWILDTSGMTIDQVVDTIVEKVQEMRA